VTTPFTGDTVEGRAKNRRIDLVNRQGRRAAAPTTMASGLRIISRDWPIEHEIAVNW